MRKYILIEYTLVVIAAATEEDVGVLKKYSIETTEKLMKLKEELENSNGEVEKLMKMFPYPK